MALPFAGCSEAEDPGGVEETGIYKIACLGDSITYGSEVQYTNHRYTDRIQADEDIRSVQNEGFPGALVGIQDENAEGANMNQFSFLKRYTKIAADTDLIFVLGGTNDYGADICVPVGEMGDTTEYTFYGALYQLIQGLQETYPDALLLFGTPLQRDDEWYGAPTTTPYNSAGNTLEEYRDAVVDMCEEYGIPYVDLYNLEGMRLTDSTFTTYFADGLHPNDDGQGIMANALLPVMKSMLEDAGGKTAEGTSEDAGAGISD